MLTAPSAAQTCDSTTGTSEGIGAACVEDPTAVGFSSFANRSGATVNSPFSGESVAAGSAAANASLRPELRAALALVAGRSGAVLATGGEFRQKSGLFQALGFDDAHPLTIAMAYRSHEVDSWRIAGDGVATADDPFGPGWRASWGDLMVAPNHEGEPIVRIDEHGVRWTHTQVSQTADVVGPLDEPVINRIYDGQAGSRLVLEHYYLHGQVTPVWFREWPDRTRHQYAGQPNTGSDQVLARIYRGDFFAPDWQVLFGYDGQGRLNTIIDARGLVYTLTWTTFGATRRVTRIAVSGPWSHNWAALDIVFEYEASSPYRLQRVRKPARAFVDDQDRSGSYEPQESFTGELITRYTYVGGSNRIERVYDESTGLSRLQLEVVYDTVVPWRATVLRVGETSSLPGQGQRVHGFAYPQAGRMVWTDPRGVVRQYDVDTSFGSSPRQWRVTRIEEFAGANDPRPTNDPHHYGSLVWSYAWNCGCGELREVTLPSGIKHSITYDTEGRGLVTATGIVPAGQGTPQQVRTWTYRSWNDPDYRLASRLSGYTDALAKTGVHSFAFDATYGGYRVTGTFAGTELFTLQEDSKGRMVWREEGTFQVDGGGTSRNRQGFQFGTSSSQADYLLVNRIDTYQGTSVVAWRTLGYTGMGWLASLTDEKGRTTTLVSDDVGLLRQGILPTTSTGHGSATYGAMFQFEYDRFGQAAIAKQTAHDDQGAAYARTHVERVRVFDYFGRPWKELTDVAPLDQASPQWLTTIHEYDLGNRLVRVQASGGRETVYLIDDHGRLYQRRSKLDGSTWSVEQHGYHPDGVLARVVEPTGLEGTVDGLDAWGRPQWVHLPGQKHLFFVRDDEDRVTIREYRIGAVGSTVLKQAAAWALDDLGRILTESISAPGLSTSRTATLAYNGPFRVATVVDGDGRGWTLGYDYLGRTVRRQDRLLGTSGNAEVFVRDVLGVVTRVDHVEQRQTGPSSYSPLTYRTDLVYDDWDRLIRTEFWGKAASLQSTRHRAHDSLGNLTWTKDGVGKEVRRAFDAAGRMVNEWIHQRNAALTPIHLGLVYDDQPADPLLSAILTRTDGLGNASEYRYDLLGRMVERRLPGYVAGSGAKRWTYEYDLAGRLTGWLDGNGTRVRQVYDAEKRRQRREVLQLPTNGVMLSRLATEETWTYDDFDRVGSAQTWWSIYPQFESGDLPSLVEAVGAFDGIGRQTLERFRYLDDGNPGYVPLATKDLVYGYSKPGGGEDAAFTRSMATSAGFQLGYAPDGAGKLAAMTMSGPGIAPQQLADWRYEGGRPIRTSFLPGPATGPELVGDFLYDDLRHMTQIASSLVAGGSTPVYDLEMERDVEGNVLQHRFSKASNKAGDWFLLDGWDRLQEVKLGVTGFTGTYQSATGYDDKITYALDAAHNRQTVDEEASGNSTSYTLAGGTNEYKTVTDPYGTLDWLYDGNGNLLSDGYFLYVYDHLDRLSEVYLLTYPGGAYAMTASGQRQVRVFREDVQRARKGNPTRLSRQGWRDRVLEARARVSAARTSARMEPSDPRAPTTANAGTSTAQLDEDQVLLIVYYGYDPHNRRIGKLLPDGGAFYAWSGWDMTEAYDLAFQPGTVWLDGALTDEHMGYVQWDGGSGNWVRYAYVLDHTRGIARVLDASGTPLERYEFDPYGRMSAYSPAGQYRGSSPTVQGQVYGFAGRQLDAETGLQYHRHRYYQPLHGRFLTQDPRGHFGDPLSWGSPYAYAGSAPTSYWDPSGMYTIVVVVTHAEQREGSVGGNVRDAEAAAAKDPEGGRVIHIHVDKDGVPKVVDSSEVPPEGHREGDPAPRKTKTDVILSAHGTEDWRTSRFFGGGSHTPGGKATFDLVNAMLDAVFAEQGMPGMNRKEPDGGPGGVPVRGPTRDIKVWMCFAGKKEWQEDDKRDRSIAAVADHFNKKLIAWGCELPGHIDEKWPKDDKRPMPRGDIPPKK